MSLFSNIYQVFYQAINESKLNLFCIKPYCSRACSRKKKFAWSRLVYQTNEHKRAFYRVELELFMNSLAHLKKMKG